MNRKVKAVIIEAVCTVTTNRQTLEIAKWWEMKPNGRAATHLDQYLEGKGDLTVDLAKLLQEDSGVRSKVTSEIAAEVRKGKKKGTVKILPLTYKNRDWYLAIGSMNINWKYPSRKGPDKVHVGFRNKYRWHPKEARITQCVHQAADELKVGEAKEYWMEGAAEIRISAPQSSANGASFHVVVSGDTLERIALRYYRDRNRWRDIHAANKNVVRDPNRLAVGTRLELPGQTK
jgi:nucleoid-associated protein YgaU